MQELFVACRSGDSKRALDVLSRHPHLEINKREINGCTAVFYAARMGMNDVVIELLQRGADPKMPENTGVTPLSVACVEGRTFVVETLISAGCGSGTDYILPLLAATQYNHPQIVRRLLNSGANVDVQLDDEGATPLYVACELGYEEIVVLLISNSASVNIKRAGISPLLIATQNRFYKIVERLLKAGADVNCKTIDGVTPLLIASQGGDLKMVRILLSQGANVNIQMKDGSSPLYVAAARNHLPVVVELLNNNADPSLSVDDSSTCIHVACQIGSAEIAEAILKHPNKGKELVNVKRKDGLTPLHIAARHGQAKVLKVLLENNADFKCECEGETALDVAERYGRSESIKVLREFQEKN
eukprot:TRINITY_DN8507_c0_g1_i1.p1 TRINITY_DN8507_c0_g1~~TRINITY_DN8507_c0_g1_i1.p1  ORF type:complete len:359 (-),score=71.85 TRINITY_DN8507_c0_g1_i1:166-1242(-)